DGHSRLLPARPAAPGGINGTAAGHQAVHMRCFPPTYSRLSDSPKSVIPRPGSNRPPVLLLLPLSLICPALLAVAFLCTTGCALFPGRTARAAPAVPLTIELATHTALPQQRTIYVTSNGFHAGLVLRRDDVPRDIWPEVDEIAAHEWVEVGWG